MIGWKPVAKPVRKMPNAGQMRGAAKAAERKAVASFWAKGATYDAMNFYWADEWLQQRAELGENHHRVLFAIAVMNRLYPEMEF